MQPTKDTRRAPRERFSIPIRADDRSLIEQAAKATGKTPTAFVREAARAAAEEVLLEQTLIVGSPEAYAAFLARLERPPIPNERLRKTLRMPAPWEKS
ncbi:DUF1778 domain-containing protein [Cupriavidus malaysiensis]|uniref:CopG family transcriptional regulator n=1 Tax=Cupriavidus malaysiensis TaxID=367825 RepID=A0ABN4TXA8_9BURK|nr:DUF1778 domain-containing protein [Cupriavidus malaysiensis]AOZ11214.1 CopG family transcriptional regulator [Cupriavidus malaysiensis]